LGIIIILFFYARNNEVGLALIVAYVSRVVIALLHRFVIALPQGSADAVSFEKIAYKWSASGPFGVLIEHFDPTASYVYSALLGELYALTGRSPLMAQFVNCIIGVIAVYLVSSIAAEIWGPRAEKKAVWSVGKA
jgi:hypothetical protein